MTYPKSMCKRNSFFVILGAPRRKKRYCFFREHPAYCNLKMYSVLILFLFFWFPTIHPKCFCKSHFFLKFQVLHERSSVIASFMEHPVCSNFKMYSELILFLFFWFPTIHPKCFCKSHFFLKFQVLHERSSVIASFMEHPVCSNFKMYSELILFFYFDFPLFTQNASAKVIYSWNFKCSPKEAVILLLPWSSQYIAAWKSIVP